MGGEEARHHGSPGLDGGGQGGSVRGLVAHRRQDHHVPGRRGTRQRLPPGRVRWRGVTGGPQRPEGHSAIAEQDVAALRAQQLQHRLSGGGQHRFAGEGGDDGAAGVEEGGEPIGQREGGGGLHLTVARATFHRRATDPEGGQGGLGGAHVGLRVCPAQGTSQATPAPTRQRLLVTPSFARRPGDTLIQPSASLPRATRQGRREPGFSQRVGQVVGERARPPQGLAGCPARLPDGPPAGRDRDRRGRLGCLAQQAHDQVLQCRGDLGALGAQAGRARGQVLAQDLAHRVPDERWPSRQAGIQDKSGGIEVGARVDVGVQKPRLLRRQVGDDLGRPVPGRVPEIPAAEPSQIDHANPDAGRGLGHDAVARTEVAVQHSAPVHVPQAPEQVAADREGLAGAQSAAPQDHVQTSPRAPGRGNQEGVALTPDVAGGTRHGMSTPCSASTICAARACTPRGTADAAAILIATSSPASRSRPRQVSTPCPDLTRARRWKRPPTTLSTR